MDVNRPFFVLYNYVSDQWRTGPTGAVALDMLAVNQGMDDYNVDRDERILFSTKVRQIANIIIALRRAEEEQKASKQGNG